MFSVGLQYAVMGQNPAQHNEMSLECSLSDVASVSPLLLRETTLLRRKSVVENTPFLPRPHHFRAETRCPRMQFCVRKQDDPSMNISQQ
ncbi:hypothetical protein AAFF_G00097360 [Aldrovandia affinis]|uniref:Uncharacterized protein n=1 Tax=Aldrovandia affinis TaxID=143900 RepID=A0AAD7RVR4_9TELE|nr:hypothetical protein AAFF_G00097360 [Aldrovandia affinis]